MKVENDSHEFYTWKDDKFRHFMLTILRNLEPMFMDPNELVFNHLEEVSFVTFIERGYIKVGFEMNKKRHFVCILDKKYIVGGFEASKHM